MKIAIFHDYFDKIGGGERLVINLAKELNADIYTGFVDNKNTFSFSGIKVVSLNVNKGLPAVIRNLKISKRFKDYKFPKYDCYIFSGLWCISAAKNNHPNILYLHTPPRFIYDLKEYYLKNCNFVQKRLLGKLIKYWKPKDRDYINQFDIICPNSNNVKGRVLEYYGENIYKKCKTVYTGIETKKFYFKKYGDFYLSTSRLDSLKRIDLIIKTFNTIPNRKLLIVGVGPQEDMLKKMAAHNNNIKFLGKVSENKLLELYSLCKATIVASVDEDLGLSAIESQAAGKPVLVVKEGGFKETVIDGKTGYFFKPNKHSLKAAIYRLENKKWDYKKIQKHVKQFDINVFSNKIKKIIKEII